MPGRPARACSCRIGQRRGGRRAPARCKPRGSRLTLTRMEGTSRYMQLRRADLAMRFPGLLDAVIASARDERLVRALAAAPVKKPAAMPADRKTAAARRG